MRYFELSDWLSEPGKPDLYRCDGERFEYQDEDGSWVTTRGLSDFASRPEAWFEAQVTFGAITRSPATWREVECPEG